MGDFAIRNPGYEAMVRTSFAKQGFMSFLDANLEIVEPGYCQISIPYSENVSQQHGFFHGGIVGTLVDNAGGYAAFSLMEAGDGILTVEYKVNLMAPALGQRLVVRADVLRPGKTLTVCQANVFAINNGAEKHCAVGQITLMGIKGNPTVSG